MMSMSWLWTQVNITRLRRVVLDNGTAEGAPRADPADAAQQAEPDKAACDVEFTSILSRCGGRGGGSTSCFWVNTSC